MQPMFGQNSIAEPDNLTMIHLIDSDSPLTSSVSRLPYVHIGRPTARISKNLTSVEDEQI